MCGCTRQVGTARTTGVVGVGPALPATSAAAGGTAGGVVAWRVNGQYRVQEIIMALHLRQRMGITISHVMSHKHSGYCSMGVLRMGMEQWFSAGALCGPPRFVFLPPFPTAGTPPACTRKYTKAAAVSWLGSRKSLRLGSWEFNLPPTGSHWISNDLIRRFRSMAALACM